MKPILVDAMLNKVDYLAYCRFRSYYIAKTRFNVYLFPMIIMLFVILNFMLGNTPVIALVITMLVFLPVLMEISLRMYSAKVLEHFSNNETRKEYSLVFQQDKIAVHSKTENANYKLAEIWRIYKTKRYIYVFVTPIKGFIAPITCFKQGEVESLCEAYQKVLKKEQMFIKKPWYEKER